MSIQRHFNSWIQYHSRLPFVGSLTRVDSTRFRLLLSESSDFAVAFSGSQVFQRERPIGSGYTRGNPSWANSGTFDSANRRDTLDTVEVQFTSTGGALQYRSAVLVANADPLPGIQIAAISGNTVHTVGAHGRAANNQIMIKTTSGGSTLPTGLTADGLYFANVVSSTSLQYRISSGGSVVTLSSAGAGGLMVVYADGDPVWYRTEDATITIPAGQTHKYQITHRGRSTAT